jgi:soluble lytic murein transglycosylase
MKTLIVLFMGILTLNAFSLDERSIASIKPDVREEHARELLGSRYERSFISKLDDQDIEIEKHIIAIFERYLPKQYKEKASKIAHVLIVESMKHELDPYFLIALIAGESSFNPHANGPVGEIGLMQIRPSTARWIAKLEKMPYRGKRSLKNPIENIKLGVAYISWIREKFDNHAQLYLAAYNMGRGNVNKALSKNVWPKDYPKHVMKRYFALYKGLVNNVAHL